MKVKKGIYSNFPEDMDTLLSKLIVSMPRYREYINKASSEVYYEGLSINRY